MRRHDRACWIWLLVSASLLAGMVEPAGAVYYGRHGRYYRPYPYWTQKKHVRQVKVYGADGSARPAGIVEPDIRPRDAEVLVDGAVIGQVREFDGPDGLLFMAPGRYMLTFRAPGYMTLTRPVTVASGSTQRLADRLGKGDGPDPRSGRPFGDADDPGDQDRDEGRVSIRATPDDAAVYVNGEFLGLAYELGRLETGFPAGDHMIEVVRPGFEGDMRSVQVTAGATQTVRIELRRVE